MRLSKYHIMFFLLASTSIHGQEKPTAVQLRKMLTLSQHRGQLVSNASTPFHLIAHFEQFDLNGKPAGTGKLDELWAGPKRYRQTLTIPAIKTTTDANGREHSEQILTGSTRTLVEVDNGMLAWRTGQWVLFGDTPTTPVLSPFALLSDTTNRLSVETVPPASPDLDCIGTQPNIEGVPNDTPLAMSTYCLAKGSHLLRLIELPNATEMAFNDIHPFNTQYIARSIEVGFDKVIRLRIHVDLIENATDFSGLDVAVPPDAQTLSFHRADIPFTSTVLMSGQLLTKVSPQYPQAGLRGTITVKIHVNTKGEVESEEVLSSENQVLKAPVLAAIKQWRFRVSYQNTRLVPVDHVYRFRYGGDEALN